MFHLLVKMSTVLQDYKLLGQGKWLFNFISSALVQGTQHTEHKIKGKKKEEKKLMNYRPMTGQEDQLDFEVKWSESRLVMSDSLQPQGLYSSWNSPGQNTGVCSLSLLQGIFPTQGSNPGLPHCRWILYQLSNEGSPNRTLSIKRKRKSWS